MKMLPGNESSQTIALSQVLAQRRVQTVSLQKPPQIIQQVDAMAGSSQQQGSIQTTTSQQTVNQPQNSPQMVK